MLCVGWLVRLLSSFARFVACELLVLYLCVRSFVCACIYVWACSFRCAVVCLIVVYLFACSSCLFDWLFVLFARTFACLCLLACLFVLFRSCRCLCIARLFDCLPFVSVRDSSLVGFVCVCVCLCVHPSVVFLCVFVWLCLFI